MKMYITNRFGDTVELTVKPGHKNGVECFDSTIEGVKIATSDTLENLRRESKIAIESLDIAN